MTNDRKTLEGQRNKLLREMNSTGAYDAAKHREVMSLTERISGMPEEPQRELDLKPRRYRKGR